MSSIIDISYMMGQVEPEPAEPGAGVKLEHEGLVVAIQNQPRPAVALAVDQAIAIGLVVKEIAAPIKSLRKSCGPPTGIDGLWLADVKNAHANGRVRIE